jgi:hypothetical protein
MREQLTAIVSIVLQVPTASGFTVPQNADES